MRTCKGCRFFVDRDDSLVYGNCFAYPPEPMQTMRWKSFFTNVASVNSIRVSVALSDVACREYISREPELVINSADLIQEGKQ